MMEIHNLSEILEEIIEDERLGTARNRKLSQAEIKQMLLERQKLAAPNGQSRKPLGEALVEEGLISAEQLQEALRSQAQQGDKLDSILIQLGYISNKELLQFLTTQHGIESADLFDLNISQEALDLLPARILRTHRVLPLKVEADLIHLAMEDPEKAAAISEVEFFTGKKVFPTVIPSYQIDLAIEYLDKEGHQTFSGREIRQSLQGPAMTENLLQQLVTAKGCDLILTAGSPPWIRLTRGLEKLSLPAITPSECIACAQTLMDGNRWKDFLNRKQIQYILDHNHLGRFRINVYKQKDTVSLTIRYINHDRLQFGALGLPDWLQEFTHQRQGLILLASPPRQGKTTTLAAMIDTINTHGNRNIITLEDPIEYLHTPKNGALSQIQIGKDAGSFAKGLQHIYRQSPDVIAISEIRDFDTLKIALDAAATGHLVLTTVSAANVTEALHSMLTLFPQHLQTRARQQIARTLLVAFWQELLPGEAGNTDIVVYEKLITSETVQNLIREGNLDLLRMKGQIAEEDFCALETTLSRLVAERKISAAVADSY